MRDTVRSLVFMSEPSAAKPISCAVCATRISQAGRGRSKMYCSDACRVRSQRLKRASQLMSEIYADQVRPEPIETPRGSHEAQISQAILEARATGFAFERLGHEARPDLAWRCARVGQAILKALKDNFGEAGK